MKKINQKKAVHKAFNIVSLTALVFYMTLAGFFIGPKASSAIGAVGPCPDFNGDSQVNLSDFAYLGIAYGTSLGQPGYNPQADFDYDNDVDEIDKTIFSLYYNKPFTCGQNRIVNIKDMLCPDFNDDGKVNLSDFAFFSQYMTGQNIEWADFDGDGNVDADDLTIFSIFYNTDYDCGGPETIMSAGEPYTVTGVLQPTLGCFPNFLESNQPNFVDLSDFSWFGAHFNTKTGDANYQSLADVNGDGFVNDYDKSVFEVYYNKPFTCDSPVCGNAIVESGEGCDDGNITSTDGCSNVCLVEPSYACIGQPSVCTLKSNLGEVKEVPVITLEKIDTPDPVKAGDNITYRLDYAVAGTLVNDLKLMDTLPTNTTFISASDSGTYDNATKKVTWDLGSVAIGSYSVTLVVKVDGVLANGTLLTNTATLDSNETDPVTATQKTTVNSSATLSVVKSVEKSPVNPGDKVNYIVTIKNNGSDTAINLRLADTMPAGFTYDDGSAGSWFFGNLTVGEEKNFIYSVTVGTSVVPGTYTNTAQVSADNVPAITATANLDVIAKPGVVLGAETEAPVVAAAETSLPKAGIDLAIYLIVFTGLTGLAFVLKK